MMGYPEDMPVCDVMVKFEYVEDDLPPKQVVLDTLPEDWIELLHYRGLLDFYFSTEEKVNEAIQHGSYGYGVYGETMIPQPYKIVNAEFGFVVIQDGVA